MPYRHTSSSASSGLSRIEGCLLDAAPRGDSRYWAVIALYGELGRGCLDAAVRAARSGCRPGPGHAGLVDGEVKFYIFENINTSIFIKLLLIQLVN